MKEPLRIAICEDTKSDLENLLEILDNSEYTIDYTVFPGGEALLDEYKPNKYDLLFMDIYMGGMNGVETVTKIREIDREVSIAFMTTSKDHALEGYRLSVLKYIEKPVSTRAVEEVLRIVDLIRNTLPSISLYRNGKEEKILLSQLMYAEQQTHKLNFYLADGTEIQAYEKLSDCINILNENGFYSPHKSFSINLSFVREIDTELKCFVMFNGTQIPIRRENLTKAKKIMETFLFNKARGMLNAK